MVILSKQDHDRDNLRATDILKPMECEMCSEFKIVQQLMFDCIVARALWDMVDDIFMS